jgi:dipeptidase
MILAGRKVSRDGSVLSGHNDDLQGNNASLYEILDHKVHTEESIHKVSKASSRPLTKETQRCLILKTWRGFQEGDAVAINEHQVAIAGGVDLGVDRNTKAAEADPLVKNGVSGEARYIALQSARSARECVELLGKMYSDFGVSYPSGVGISDPNESWYMESGGGRSWAAVKVPDECCLVQGNGYRIREIDPSDKNTFVCSRNLLDFARDSGLWDPSKEQFEFCKAFGGYLSKRPDTQYLNTRRVWAAVKKLSPKEKWDPNIERFPLFVRPEEKLTPRDIMSILRDTYDNTEFKVNPDIRLRNEERPIAVPSCVHTDVIQLRGWLPADLGGVMWGGIGSPNLTTYIPFHFGTKKIAYSFAVGGPEYDDYSAFWQYRALSSLVLLNYGEYINTVQNELQFFEKTTCESFEEIENEIRQNKFGIDDCDLLTDFSVSRSDKSLKLVKELYGALLTRIAKEMHLIFSCNGLEW